MNHIMVAGHLGAEPEVRFTSSGQKVTTFRIASNSRRGGKEETTWWRITVWGEQFDKMMPYLKKGSSVIIFGELSKPEIYNDREGNPQISLNITASNIQFSPFGRSSQDGGQHNQQNSFAEPHQSARPAEQPSQGFGQEPQMSSPFDFPGESSTSKAFADDEIPF